jgi:hypothetical protein
VLVVWVAEIFRGAGQVAESIEWKQAISPCSRCNSAFALGPAAWPRDFSNLRDDVFACILHNQPPSWSPCVPAPSCRMPALPQEEKQHSLFPTHPMAIIQRSFRLFCPIQCRGSPLENVLLRQMSLCNVGVRTRWTGRITWLQDSGAALGRKQYLLDYWPDGMKVGWGR